MQVAITKEILQIIRSSAHQQDISLSEYGRRAGVSKAWLSKLQHTEANLSLETAIGLLHAAGYDLKIVRK
jgi:transcriptional regulator with XRE-family HTH domain